MIRRALLGAALIAVYLAVRLLWMPGPEGSGQPLAPGSAQPALETSVALLDAKDSFTGQGSTASATGEAAPDGVSLPVHSSPTTLGPAPLGLVAFPVAVPSGTAAPLVVRPAGEGAAPPSALRVTHSETPASAAAKSAPPPSPAVTPASVAPRGGIVSPDPAGDWVTSLSSTAKYYCHVSDRYWEDWSGGNRVWFATEAALLSAYSDRLPHVLAQDGAPTAISVPSTASPPAVATAATPSHSPVPSATSVIATPTSTGTSRPTSTVRSAGTVSPDPAGNWVTSTHPSTTRYTTRANEVRWMEWAPSNRVWFATEQELLSAYPGRTFEGPALTSTPRPSATPVTPTSTRTPTSLPTATRTPTSSPPPTAIPSTIPTPTPAPSATPEPTATPTSAPEPTSTSTLEPTPSETPTVTPEPPTATVEPTVTPEPPTETPTSAPSGILSPDPAGDWVTSVADGVKYYCSRDSSYWLTWSPENRIWFQTTSDLLAVYPDRTRR